MRSMTQQQALRAIGQDLERRDIRTFDIRCEQDVYVVQGGYQDPPGPMPITVHYSSADLENLNQEGNEKRDRGSGDMEFLKLSLILRAIGAHVERKGARLLRISNGSARSTTPIFTIEYETAAGEQVSNDLTSAAVYDICVSTYKLRGKMAASGKYRMWRR
jgi:hypothetical protein